MSADIDDKQLESLLRQAMPSDGPAPGFDRVYAAAELASRRRRHGSAWLAVASVAIAAVIVTFVLQQHGGSEHDYLQVADLLETTSWTAPSDALLPTRDIDLYDELPVLLESTKPVEGALL